MQKPATLNLIFNGLAILLGIIVVGYVVREAFQTHQETPCSTRYPAPMRFALRSDQGTLLSPIELQARTGLSEWGVMSNANVIADGPGGAALQVALEPVPDREPTRTQRANGIGFTWLPTGPEQASAACLSYSIWLPNDFEFAFGGVLPGIFGGTPAALMTPEANEGRFGMRPEWRALGLMALYVARTGLGYKELNQRKFAIERGRWLHLEQELVLNAPGKTNGIVRLWVDGRLKAEDTGLALRNRPEVMIAGVNADIGYLRQPAKPGSVRISAFELAWR